MNLKDDYKQRYKQSNTRKKYAETIIDIGSKFYFAAFALPLAYFIKQDEHGFDFYLFALFTLLILGFGGSFFQKYGLRIYDDAENK